MRIDIVNIKSIKIAALEHQGGPETLEQTVESFRAWQKESGCSPVTEKRSFGVARSNPDVRPIQPFRFDICGEVDADVAENSYGVKNKGIPAGRCAKVRHIGSHDGLQSIVNSISRVWLPSSENVRRGAPIFFEYLNVVSEVAENKRVTDIYFPIR